MISPPFILNVPPEATYTPPPEPAVFSMISPPSIVNVPTEATHTPPPLPLLLPPLILPPGARLEYGLVWLALGLLSVSVNAPLTEMT